MKILLNIGTHGDEKIGKYVAERLEKLSINRAYFEIKIANERAFNCNQRYIDQDLNRSFPGRKNGNYEQRRAYELMPAIKRADVVIDIHSTTSELKDALIVTKLDKKTRKYIEVIGPKYALVMNATKDSALISHAKTGIAFEYGKDKDPNVIKKVTAGISSLLSYLGVIPRTVKKSMLSKPIFMDVYDSISKPEGALLKKDIKNYKLVKKGMAYAMIGKKQIIAEKNFYPVLCGNKNYKDIFGFAAKKISLD